MVKAGKNLAKDIETKPVKLKMTANDRLFIAAIFPEKENIIGQMLVRDITSKIELNQTELTKIKFKPRESGGFEWKSKNLKVKIIEFTFTEIQFLRDQVTRLDDTKQITSDILELCLKIKG